LIFSVRKVYFCPNKQIKMSREERNTVGYVVALISEFAAFFGIQPRQAYAYLKRFKGLEHLEKYYGVLHTQSFPDAIEAMAEVCAHNGGQLK
jgi:hypothetical protein